MIVPILASGQNQITESDHLAIEEKSEYVTKQNSIAKKSNSRHRPKSQSNPNSREMTNQGWETGQKSDFKETAEWYRKSTNQGYPEAQYNLGHAIGMAKVSQKIFLKRANGMNKRQLKVMKMIWRN